MGLIDSAMTQGATPAEQSQAETPAPGGMSPEQAQETHLKLGQAAMRIVYTNPESDHLVSILKAGKDNPVMALAQATMAVIGRMQKEIKGIDPNQAYSVAATIVVFLLEIGVTAKVLEVGPEIIPDVMDELAKMHGEQEPVPTGMPPGQPMQQMPQMGA